MPTSRPRHTITETPPVAHALRRLRALTPDNQIDLKELIVIGANKKADDLERGAGTHEHDAELEGFLALRAGPGIDAEAALALHEQGWAPRV